jgi:glycosyltransferase involved in cell wall biosynthesis
MNLPCISVVIPSFNQVQYLEQAIQSVLMQEGSQIELIVIDGGSSDGSLEIIHKHASSLTYWESIPDRGQAHAINKGFARCIGEIITFLGSDDFYLPGTFQNVVEHYLRNPGAGAIVGAFSFLDAGSSMPGEPIRPFIDGPTPADLTLGPPGKYRLHQVSTFYSRSALDRVGRCVREDMRYVLDRELLYRICRQYPIVISQKTYGVFRRHGESKSVSEILPFSREFAKLYRSALSGDARSDRQRRKMAAYRISRGYLKYAAAVDSHITKFNYLIRAALAYPDIAFTKSYWTHYSRI